MAKDTAATLEARIREAVHSAACDVQESLIKEAVLQFERDLRKAVGAVAVEVANYFTIERMANQLVIRVQIDSNP